MLVCLLGICKFHGKVHEQGSTFTEHSTQPDIARELNVTRITVSKILKNHPDIPEAMKKKVIITAEKSGYTSNLIAQNFNAKKTYTPGVVVTDLENSSFAYATDSIIDTADGHFNLYEDEGDNFNQKNSKFRFIPFNWNERIQTLTFGKREGSFKGMLNKRTIQID